MGAHLGTVMVAERVPSTWERLQGTSSYLLTYLGIALVLGLARLVAALPADQAPDARDGAAEIAGLAEHARRCCSASPRAWSRSTRNDRITLVNDVARQLLDLPEHAVGMSIGDLRIEGRLREVLVGEHPAHARRARPRTT